MAPFLYSLRSRCRHSGGCAKHAGLLDLPDETILGLTKLMVAQDLKAMSRVSRRLARLCGDGWRDVCVPASFSVWNDVLAAFNGHDQALQHWDIKRLQVSWPSHGHASAHATRLLSAILAHPLVSNIITLVIDGPFPYMEGNVVDTIFRARFPRLISYDGPYWTPDRFLAFHPTLTKVRIPMDSEKMSQFMTQTGSHLRFFASVVEPEMTAILCRHVSHAHLRRLELTGCLELIHDGSHTCDLTTILLDFFLAISQLPGPRILCLPLAYLLDHVPGMPDMNGVEILYITRWSTRFDERRVKEGSKMVSTSP